MAEPNTTPQPSFKKKRKTKKIIKRVISLVLIAALVGGVLYGIKKLSAPEEVKMDVLTDTVNRGTISSMVEDSGMLVSKNNASISIPSDGIVEELLVSEGDFVTAGQPLYRISSPALQENIRKAGDDLKKARDQLTELQNQKSDLVITAPAAGQLQGVAELVVGQQLSAGASVATLVENTRLRLSQYYSYTYLPDISVGQKATISVPAVMSQLPGRVEQINKVQNVSPEGSLLFEVVFVLDNPGTLTEDMTASAVLETKSGETIFPYAHGTLHYYNKQIITVRTPGPVRSFDLLNYGAVKQGQVLVTLGSESLNEQIEAAEKKVQEAQDALEKLQAETLKLEASAPIDGTVMSLGLMPEGNVTAGSVAITISDNRVLQLNAQVDERNVSYVKTGMEVQIDQWGNLSTGTVEKVSLTSSQQGNMASFPVTIAVDNSGNQLRVNSYCSFSFASDTREDVLFVPLQAVKLVEAKEGGSISVVFVESEAAPENAVELASRPADIPEGYWPVQVETGLADQANVEILSGLEEGTVIFLQTVKQQADSFMGM